MSRVSTSDSDGELVGHIGTNPETNLKKAFEEHVRPYIELVDGLRQEGLEQDISLPSIIVIGDQSSGKSSILEAISGVQLPRGSGIVTRCPLIMQLKRTTNFDKAWKATLQYQTATGQKQDHATETPSELGYMIRKAQDEIAGEKKRISKELITLKVESPSCPDLTLIDLPGIARTAIDDQPSTICTDIKQLLKDYMEKEHTIMLCVIPSNVDIAVNEALSMAKEVDPSGVRTLGVLTKPDLVDVGTESEVISIVNNKRFHLRNGYSIVRCRGQKDIDDGIDLKLAVEQEEDFFRRHSVFRAVNEEQRGTQKLALKLTDQLVEHIKRTLPKIKEDVRQKLEKAQKELSSISEGPPSSESGKRSYLMKLIRKVMKELEASIKKGEQIPSSVTENVLLEDDLCSLSTGRQRMKHRAWDRPVSSYSNKTSPREENDLNFNTSYLWRMRFENFRDAIEKLTEDSFSHGDLTVSSVQQNLNRYRGRELPRFINFDLFEKLVKKHVKQYLDISLECLKKMSKDLRIICDHVCGEVLASVPSTKGKVRGICEDSRLECMEKGQELMKLEMKKEKLVYTQDTTFISELKRLEVKAGEDSQKNVYDQTSSQSRGKLSFKLSAAEEEEESQNNAQVMQQLLKVYIDVANRRIQDNIPMLIRTTQHMQYLHLVEKRLLTLAASENIDDLVNEDPKVAAHRKELEKSCERLSCAVKMLNYTPS